MNIYVGNMSYDVSEDELRQAFEQFGEVSSVSIITDRDTGRPKGFAFVEMPDSAAAQNAMQQLNGTALKGRNINVNEAKPREPRRNGGGGGGGGGSGGGSRGRRW